MPHYVISRAESNSNGSMMYFMYEHIVISRQCCVPAKPVVHIVCCVLLLLDTQNWSKCLRTILDNL